MDMDVEAFVGILIANWAVASAHWTDGVPEVLAEVAAEE